MSNSIDYFRDKAADLEQSARVWAALGELADANAVQLAEPHRSYFQRQARDCWAESKEKADHAAQTRRVIAAMEAHPSSQCDRPLDEHCPEHDDAPHLRPIEQPREHAVLCRGLHNMGERPETWNTSGLCSACLAKRPKTWRKRSLAERELLDRVRDLSESMDDAS